ncbi:glutamate receptor ionotropic, delta-1-like isoform X1 [Daphnia pulex]|uniref:glutamate receptor ionotropic, delta-1-like isoform X1 n=1 Tax=Daphnia pulex TaxID=6669 RepID=UPI001EDE9ADB|nr:glutamate receptor ionotropic, delta-1-like isoform X1 [Daphnia pulex]
MSWYHRRSVLVVILTILPDHVMLSTKAESTEFNGLLNGKILRVAAVEISPFVEFVRDENGIVVDGKGFSFEILAALMETYNFSITIEVPKDKAYGALLANGTWNGMIGMILNNESDVGIGSFSVTHVRNRVVDFTVAYYEESSGILIPAPTLGKQTSAFVKPFHFRVWIILIAILGILPCIMWVQSKILAKAKMSMARKREQRFMLVYGVLLTQCKSSPLSYRIVFRLALLKNY